MRHHVSRQKATLIPLVLAVALLTAGTCQVLAFGQPGSNEVSLGVDTTEWPSSLYPGGITIHSSRFAARNDPTLAYSLNLDNLAAGERVRITGSVYTSYCVGSDINGTGNPGSPCTQLAGDGVPNPNYDVKLEVHLFKATGPGDASDATTAYLNTPAPVTCTYDGHHCPVTEEVSTTLTGTSKTYINADISAWTTSGQRQPPDRAELEGDCYQGGSTSYINCTPVVGNQPDPRASTKLASTKGQLSVLRLGSSYGTPPAPTTRGRSSTRIDDADVAVNTGSGAPPTVVHSTEIDNLVAGDVLEVDGTVDISGTNFDHAASSWWVLSSSPSTTRPPSGGSARYVSANNATNCLGANGLLTSKTSGYCSATRTPPTLPVRQAGAVTVPGVTGGIPSKMYLNYVVSAEDGTFNASPTAKVDSGSFEMRCSPNPRPTGNTTPLCSFPAQ